MSHVIALYNIKGGVGKTSAAVNLAYLASKKAKTLIIDLDPQSAASFYFRVQSPKKHGTATVLKGGKKLDKQIRATDFDNLDLLPADFSYRNMDLALDGVKKSRKRLRDLTAQFKTEYGYIIIDSPPNITKVSENIFLAADYILIPMIPTILSERTYQKLYQFFVQEGLKEERIVPFFSMVEKRKKMHQEIMQELIAGDGRFLEETIPYASDVEKMGLYRQPVCHKKPGCPASEAYHRLWNEFELRFLSK